MSFITLLIPTTSNAEESLSKEIIPAEMKEIDFSKEIPQEQQDLLKDYYLKDSQEIFNSNYAKQILKQDQLKIKEYMESNTIKKSNNYVKQDSSNLMNDSALNSKSSTLGSVGDILVTYSFTSFGADVAAVGHAGIVHSNSSYTIESFPKSKTRANGVRVYTNNWRNKSKVYGVRVSKASYANYKNAASYALTQSNAKKPYNINFFNKGTTSKFYCSQLVWRSWKNQGFEVDRMNLGNYEPVSPAELVGGSGTYVFYHK